MPILGWLFLRGKAACCGAAIPVRYVFVEVLTGVIALACTQRWLLHAPESTELPIAILETLSYFFFAGGLVVATFVDLEFMEIPEEVSMLGAGVGLVTSVLRSEPGAGDAALGAGGGFLVIQVLFVWGYERVFGRRGMGEGDAQLLMMIGAFIGWKGALFSLVLGALQGTIAAGVTLLAGRPLGPVPVDGDVASVEPGAHAPPEATDVGLGVEAAEAEATEEESAWRRALPFGPFLALGAFEYLFFGEKLVGWYLRLISG